MGHKYDYVIDLSDDTAQARVVRMVGEGKRVLEIGAGPGSMTRVFRDQRGCRVTAIEIDQESIQSLSPLCERVYPLDLDEPSWADSLTGEAKFDVVVVADVLEHLYDPWSALPKIKELIAPDGFLVASIPHSGHNAILASLLSESLQYREAGLLDKTHIRFFGIKDIEELFWNSGLTIVEAQFVIRLPEETELTAAWNSIPAATRTALLKSRFGNVYQVVLKAVPAQPHVAGLSLLDVAVEPLSGNHAASPVAAGSREATNKTPKDGVKVVAFYLPQFHPTPENDSWWGKGFTEWTNVTKAEPLFEGHYQPHLPADLGFYDLRLRQVRHEQIALAKQYGIDAFCYYYYWFSGTRVLREPLDDMLRDPESDMPFCLCWANENWTRRWDGADREILIAQKHRPNDDIEFIQSVSPFLKDPRYIRFGGAPFLVVYQPQRLPQPNKTTRIWREYCERAGIGPIHLCAALTAGNDEYKQLGFDSAVQFPPHNCECETVNASIDFYTPFHGRAVQYSAFARSYLDRSYAQTNVFRTVTPCWDQTPRVGSRAFLALNGTPENYEYWLAEALRKTQLEFPGEDRFVFVNAWNEWAEGCHLEPDRRFQRQFLEATLRARSGKSEKTSFTHTELPDESGPLTSTRAKLDEFRQRSQRQQERLTTLESELAEERARLQALYRDNEEKRERLATAEKRTETSRPRS